MANTSTEIQVIWRNYGKLSLEATEAAHRIQEVERKKQYLTVLFKTGLSI